MRGLQREGSKARHKPPQPSKNVDFWRQQTRPRVFMDGEAGDFTASFKSMTRHVAKNEVMVSQQILRTATRLIP